MKQSSLQSNRRRKEEVECLFQRGVECGEKPSLNYIHFFERKNKQFTTNKKEYAHSAFLFSSSMQSIAKYSAMAEPSDQWPANLLLKCQSAIEKSKQHWIKKINNIKANNIWIKAAPHKARRIELGGDVSFFLIDLFHSIGTTNMILQFLYCHATIPSSSFIFTYAG